MQTRKLGSLGLALGVLMAASATVRAEAPKISGFIDTTYGYNLNKPSTRTNGFRSFDNRTDTFLLNNAQLNIEGGKDGIGYYAELAYGTDASVFKSAGAGTDTSLTQTGGAGAPNFELQEAFLTYKCPITSLQFKAGKFATYQGIEVIESKDDFTISRGLLFGLAEPFTHTGAMVGYALPKYIDFWVGAVNGWDMYTDNNTGKTIVSKLGINLGDKVNGNVSILYGPEQGPSPANTAAVTAGAPAVVGIANTNNQRTSIDTTWFLSPIKMLTIGLQANAGQEDKASLKNGGVAHWYGVGIQPKINVTDKFFVGGRYEWFSDLDGARTLVPAGTILQNITIAPGVNLTEDLMARVEYRYDWSSANSLFVTSDGVASQSHQSTIGAELVYKFGS